MPKVSNQAGSSRAPGLTSGLQGSVNVHRGAVLLVPQWQCISSFVFYIFVTLVPFAVWSWYIFVVQFPARGSTQVSLCLLPGVLWLWHFLYSVGPHPVSSLYIYTFVVSRAFMAGAASQAGDADSSRAPGLTSGLQGSVNVHRGAVCQCISSFVFYIRMGWCNKPTKLQFQSILTRKILMFSNATNQPYKGLQHFLNKRQ